MTQGTHIPTPGAAARPYAGGPTLIEAAEAAGTALFSMAVPLPNDGSAPEWVTVFPKAGRVETRDGRTYDVSAATLMAAFAADALEIPVDVNHATDAAGLFGGPAPAVGWGTQLREHEGGLQLRVEWLDEGKALLSARQYKYTSPSFYQDKNRATRLKALALVTSPALGQQPALARAQGPAGAQLKAMALALGLAEGAGEAECLSAISTLRAGTVPKAEHEVLVAKLAALETGNHQAAIDALLDGALRAMKIAPAEREGYAALCATPAGFERVQQLFASKAPLMRPSGLDVRQPQAGGAEPPETLGARAARYRASEASGGRIITQAEAVRFAFENPAAGR